MPPVFLVTYTTPRTGNDITHETEWICDASYDRDRARQAFEQRFPSVAIVRFTEVD